jgi:hypothetical protein
MFVDEVVISGVEAIGTHEPQRIARIISLIAILHNDFIWPSFFKTVMLVVLAL